METERKGNQADKLIELFQEITANDPTVEQITTQENERIEKAAQSMIELDVLKLPPRQEVHQVKKQPFTFRITRPMLRFSFVVLLVAAYISFLYIGLNDALRTFFS